mmetsp:Transcript_31247/g.81970  ORF Transcript_31247/g.81970 Transcript_31247/m.81970 type:complete len:109 (+) Transcript_31247:494-820(+)
MQVAVRHRRRIRWCALTKGECTALHRMLFAPILDFLRPPAMNAWVTSTGLPASRATVLDTGRVATESAASDAYAKRGTTDLVVFLVRSVENTALVRMGLRARAGASAK